jgi:hypothetical protein
MIQGRNMVIQVFSNPCTTNTLLLMWRIQVAAVKDAMPQIKAPQGSTNEDALLPYQIVSTPLGNYNKGLLPVINLLFFQLIMPTVILFFVIMCIHVIGLQMMILSTAYNANCTSDGHSK